MITKMEGYVRRTGQNKRIWHFVDKSCTVSMGGAYFAKVLCGANIYKYSLHLPDNEPIPCLKCQKKAKKMGGKEE